MGDTSPHIQAIYNISDLSGVLLNGIIGFLFLALFSALGGGMVRDVAVGETPSIFGGVKLYAIPAVVAAP